MEKKLTVKSNFYEQEDVVNVKTEEVDELINEEIEAGNINAGKKIYKHTITLSTASSGGTLLNAGSFISDRKEGVFGTTLEAVTGTNLILFSTYSNLFIFPKFSRIVAMSINTTIGSEAINVHRIDLETSAITNTTFTYAKDEVTEL